MIKEFKEFISKGNVVDLAVAVIIGAAFGTIVKAFTEGILTPLLGAIGGKRSFDEYYVELNGSRILWGSVLTATFNFLIVAFAMFLVVKAVNKAQSLGKKTVEEAEAEETAEVILLQKIYEELRTQNAAS